MRDKEKYNSYHKKYQLERYHARRKEAIDKLGGICVQCGSDENLEFDHVDRDSKSFPISRLWGIAKDKFDEELNKCQLLCKSCHCLKTISELGHKFENRNKRLWC